MELIESFYRTQDLTGVFDRMKRYEGVKREGKTIKLYHYEMNEDNYLVTILKTNQIKYGDNPLSNHPELNFISIVEIDLGIWKFFQGEYKLQPLVLSEEV